jgi:methylated-DNA-[protein]-cysteine S-methyltransferase
VFNIPIHQEGTPFQKKVWSELTEINYGKTISYMDLAKRMGDEKVIRAAASTNGKNKIGIIVPCHRVIGTNKNLVGYAGGLWRKKWLLQHEFRITHGIQTLF